MLHPSVDIHTNKTTRATDSQEETGKGAESYLKSCSNQLLFFTIAAQQTQNETDADYH